MHMTDQQWETTTDPYLETATDCQEEATDTVQPLTTTCTTTKTASPYYISTA